MLKSIIRTALIVLAVVVGAYSLYWYLLIGFYVYQGAQGKKLFAALDDARPHAPYVSDIVRLFPDAEVTYKYFGGGDGPGFHVDVELHGRYTLSMQLPVHFDSSRRRVIGYGEPAFYLLEIDVQRGLRRSYTVEGARNFGAAEWQKIVAANGDFAAIGYQMVKNQPAPGFRSFLRRREGEAWSETAE